MRPLRATLLVVGLPSTALALLLLLALPAAAHEHYPAAPYDLTIGWVDEPAVVDEKNGLDLRVQLNDAANNTTTDVQGAQADLAALLMYGTESRVMALEPQFGRPGWYGFDFVPTREGAYSVRITGTLNGTAINVTADLEAPVARDTLGFPDEAPSAPDLAASLAAAQGATAALTARVSALEANSTGGGAVAPRVAALEADNASLKSTLLLAEALALAGLAAGALGAVLATRGRRGPPKSG